MDPNAFSKAVVDIVAGFLERELDPVIARLAAMEKMIAALPTPKDGLDADPEKVAAIVVKQMAPDHEAMAGLQALCETMKAGLPDMIRGLLPEPPAAPQLPDIPAMVADAVAALPLPAAGQDGKSVTVKDIDPIIAARIAEAVAAIELPDIGEMVRQAVYKIPEGIDGKDGKDAEPEVTARLVAQEVERAVAALPRPQDGKSVTVEELAPLIEDRVQKAMAALPVAKDGIDGVNLAGALIDRDGNLVLTLSNGATKELGRVEGKDGVDVDMAAIERSISEKVAAQPKPKDGTDGVGFDDMDVVYDGERTFTLKFIKGERTKELSFTVPVQIYRGVFQEGQTYQRGDTVSWGGSTWHCDAAGATVKPDTVGAAKAWTLSNKRGRDGKDGIVKDAPKPGPVKVG